MTESYASDALDAELLVRFSYHAPREGQPATYEALRAKALEFARMVAERVPDSRERALAFTKIEEAVMWANAGVARRGDDGASS